MNGHCGNEKTINSLSRLKIGFDIEISDNQPWSDHLLKMESAPQVLFLLRQMLELDQEVVADSTNLFNELLVALKYQLILHKLLHEITRFKHFNYCHPTSPSKGQPWASSGRPSACR